MQDYGDSKNQWSPGAGETEGGMNGQNTGNV